MEILISLIILTILSVGLASFFIYAQRGTFVSDEKIIAIQVAEKALGELKASSSGFETWAENATITNYNNAAVPELKSGGLTVTVGEFPAGVSKPEYKELKARVNWTNAAGMTQEVQAVTGIFKVSNA